MARNPFSGANETGGNAGTPRTGSTKAPYMRHIADHMLTTSHNGDHKASMTTDRLLMNSGNGADEEGE